MVHVAEFQIPAEAFALSETLLDAPDVEVRTQRVVAHGAEWSMPCFWAVGGDLEAFQAGLEADRTVEEIRDRETLGEKRFYQVEWADGTLELLAALLEAGATIVETVGRRGSWRIRTQFTAREQFDSFRALFDERGVQFTLNELAEDEYPRREWANLTPGQRDALLAAFEVGYFAVPRDGTAGDVARRLGISEQAVSERLRRGTENLIRSTLAADPAAGSDRVENG